MGQKKMGKRLLSPQLMLLIQLHSLAASKGTCVTYAWYQIQTLCLPLTMTTMPALYAGSRKPGTHTHTVVRTQDLQLFKLVVHIRAAEKEEEERERNGIYKKEREKREKVSSSPFAVVFFVCA